MVLGDVNRTRRLAGNPSVTNVTDADITQGLTYGTAQVIRGTGKTDWETDTSNVNYPSAVMAVEYYADSMIRDRFDDQRDVSSEHFKRAESLVRNIANSIVSSPTGGTGVAAAAYRSYPLNSSAVAYRSMFAPGQELVGIEQYQNIPQ